MKLEQFHFLLALKKYGSISRVAQELYTSQPAVSISIKKLEQELGYPLLKRTNRGTVFTEQGELVLEQAEIIIRALKKISCIACCEDGNLQGSLRVGALPHLCNTLLMNVQIILQERYPDFTLALEGLDTTPLVKGVENGELNLAVIQICDLDETAFFQKVEKGKLRYEPLFTDRLHFVVADTHPLLGKEKVTLEDLRAFPYVCFGNCANQKVLALTQETGYPAKITRFYEMARMRKHMALYHTVTVLPERAIAHGNMNYQVKFAPLRMEDIDWNTQVGWIHGPEPLTQAEKMVIEQLVQQCENPEFLTQA